MAHTKSGSKANQKSPRPGKRLGIKKNHGQAVIPGNIIIRQRGTQFHPSDGVKMGKDHTLFAIIAGKVKFLRHQNRKVVKVVS
jgi:large subunit ribosomal protein L27